MSEQKSTGPCLDIFSCTSHEWIRTILDRNSSKGEFQALSFYKLLFKSGIGFQSDSLFPDSFSFSVEPANIPLAFVNAPYLWEDSIRCLNENSALLKIEKMVVEGETAKILFSTHDGYEIESVVIPMKQKSTICISSQVGCRMGCTFCETGRMGLLRNLSVSEIVLQVYIIQHILKIPIKNIVFMGMGEPFDNYESVIQASKIFMDMNGFGFGRKNITISTSGRVREIQLFTEEATKSPMPNLALSLNGGDNQVRTKLMPYNRKYPLEAIFAAVSSYIEATKKEVLFAYVLLKGVNDTHDDADRVALFLKPIQSYSRLNVIPYNPQSSDRFQPPSDEVIDQFMGRVRLHGIRTFIRVTKGRSIMAGCGQLGNLALRRSLKEKENAGESCRSIENGK